MGKVEWPILVVFCNCKFILWRFIDKTLDFSRQSEETSEGSFGCSAEGRGSHLLHQLPGSRGGQAAENHPRKIIHPDFFPFAASLLCQFDLLQKSEPLLFMFSAAAALGEEQLL